MNVLVIINGPAYGSELPFNGLRLATTLAKRNGVHVRIFLHADFISGGRELAARGADLLAPVGSQLAYGHRPVDDGDELDLLSPDQTEPLARAAYRSIRDRLLSLPDDLAVHPTHGGGSFCSSVPGGRPTTTIGQERRTNPLLTGDPDEDTFVARLMGGLGSFPPYFLELRDVNRAGPTVHGSRPPRLPHLLERAGHRDVAVFAGGPGSLGPIEREA